MKSSEVKDNTFNGKNMNKPNTDSEKTSDQHHYGITGTAGPSGINDFPNSNAFTIVYDKPTIKDTSYTNTK